MLRQLCAVAEVPQSEDIGFDAVATLLREEGACLYAEKSFCVQFKAHSVRQVEYAGHQFEWFHSLDIPLFVGSVDLARQELSLYTTHNAASHVNAKDSHSAVLYLDRPSESSCGPEMHIWLGPPILRWTFEQGESTSFPLLAYQVLKRWLEIEYVNLSLRCIRTRGAIIGWTTNTVPGPTSMMALGGPNDLVKDLEASLPYLQKLSIHVSATENEIDLSMQTLGLYLLAAWMQEQGVADSKFLVQILGHKLGVFNDGFRLQMTLERSDDSTLPETKNE